MKNIIRISLFSALAIFLMAGAISFAAPVTHACSTGGSCGEGIQLSDGVSTTTPHVSDTITFTISGSVSLTASTTVTVTDDLGNYLTFVSATSSVGTYVSSTHTWDLGTLNKTTMVSLTLVATVNSDAAGQTIYNEPTALEGDCSKSISILKAGPIYVQPSMGSLTIDVNGLQNGATSTVTASDTKTSSSTTIVTGNGTTTATLALGDPYTVTATTTASGYTFTTSAGCAGTSFATGTTCVVTFTSTAPPEADLAITKATLGGISTTTPSSTVTYVLTVRAQGPATSTVVEATDTLPEYLSYVTSTPSEGSTSFAGGTLLWTIGDMASGTVATTSVVTTVSSSTPVGTPITNFATVTESASSTNMNPVNTASSTVTVEPTPTVTSCSIVSDTTNTVNGNPAALVATINPAWTASIPGASWIWTTSMVDDPTINETSTFVKTFIVSGTPSAATLSINADNSYDFVLNGTEVGSNPGEVNYTLGTEGSFNALPALHDGTNTITATVTNFGLASSTPASNPAGLLYRLDIAGVTCSSPTPTPVIPEADLAITKATLGGISTTTPSSTVTYVLTVRAQGPATSTVVEATDTLPEYLSYVTSTPSEGSTSFAGGTLLWTIGDMASGTVATTSVVTTVSSSTPVGTPITNFATVTESASSTNMNPVNTASSTVTVETQGCVGSSCGGHSTGNLDITVNGLENGATSTVTVFDDSAPTDIANVTSSASAVVGISDTYSVAATTTAPGYSVTTSPSCAGSDFAANTSCTITFSSNEADLAITKATLGGISTTTPSSTVTYVLTVRAQGPATSTVVEATDTLPEYLSYVTSTPSEGSTSFAGGTLLWTIGDMASGTVATTSVVTTVSSSTPVGTPITNFATVTESASSTNMNPVNTASSTVTVEPGACGYGTCSAVSVLKTVSDPNPSGNETITYTIAVTNLDGSASSSDITVQDSLPANLNLVSTTISQGGNPTDSGLGTITWDAGDIGPGTTATLGISVSVGSQLEGQSNIVNTAFAYTTLDPANILASSSVPISVQSAPVNPPVNPPTTPTNGGGGGGGGGGGTVTGGGGGSAYEVAIDGGAPTTATTSATLSLYGTGAYQMEISNSTDFSSSTWQPYATTLPWILTSGNGEKTVYVKYRDIQGRVLATVNDSIDLVQGQVLGAATSCGIYLNSYIKLGANNDKFEVEKLQAFLDGNLGIDLPVTGVYDTTTYKAVEAFQLKYNISVLSPWVPYGLTSDSTPTGYVYKTTQRWINLLMCNTLNLPMPVLP